MMAVPVEMPGEANVPNMPAVAFGPLTSNWPSNVLLKQIAKVAQNRSNAHVCVARKEVLHDCFTIDQICDHCAKECTKVLGGKVVGKFTPWQLAD